MLPGWALVQAGISQPLEWAEFPLAVDGAASLGMLMAASSSLSRFAARVPSLYVSAWYILGGLTFTLLAYPVGNVVPEFLPGARGQHSAGSGFTMPSGFLSRHWPLPRLMSSSRQSPAGRSTAISCR